MGFSPSLDCTLSLPDNLVLLVSDIESECKVIEETAKEDDVKETEDVIGKEDDGAVVKETEDVIGEGDDGAVVKETEDVIGEEEDVVVVKETKDVTAGYEEISCKALLNPPNCCTTSGLALGPAVDNDRATLGGFIKLLADTKPGRSFYIHQSIK